MILRASFHCSQQGAGKTLRRHFTHACRCRDKGGQTRRSRAIVPKRCLGHAPPLKIVALRVIGEKAQDLIGRGN